MFARLQLTNFTAFETLDLELSPGINVFVGYNGTGKTHLLKLLYCILDSGSHHGPKKFMERFQEKLSLVFRPDKGNVSRLIRYGSRSGKSATVHAHWTGADVTSDVHIEIGPEGVFDPVELLNSPFQEKNPVFIPVKEALSFAQGFISLYDQYELAFDEIYYDIMGIRLPQA